MMEKWEDRKYFNFPPFCLVESEKVDGWKKKKKSLQKLTHIHLLKNDVQSKQKFDKQRKKKITQIY